MAALAGAFAALADVLLVLVAMLMSPESVVIDLIFVVIVSGRHSTLPKRHFHILLTLYS